MRSGIGCLTAAVSFVKRVASRRTPIRSVRGDKQDRLRLGIAPGKHDLTSRAKGTALPTVARFARRAGCIERCLSGSTEACRSNPRCCPLPLFGRDSRNESNPDTLSDDESRLRGRGRCGKTLQRYLVFARPSSTKWVKRRFRWNRQVIPPRGFGLTECVQPGRRGELRAWQQAEPG